MSEGRDTTLLARPAELVRKPANVPGKLTVSHQQVRWVPTVGGSAQEIALKVSNIAGQQRAKGKPFLRFQLASGSPVVFVFSSEVDRDAAVDILAPLINKKASPSAAPSGQKGSAGGQAKLSGSDGSLKEKILAEDRDMKALYDQLMQQGVISDAEFWATRQRLLIKAKAGDRPAQKPGLSTSMVTDIRPTADGQSSTVKISISPELMPQLFAERREVHRCYLANVPQNMTDGEFWHKFGRYEWARRMRQLSKRNKEMVNRMSVEDQEILEMFERFKDTEESKDEARRLARQAPPTVNLAANTYDDLGGASGFGTAFNGGKEGGRGLVETTAASDIIRDLNRHAAVVLDGIEAGASKDIGELASVLAKAARSKVRQQGDDWDKANHDRWAAISEREGHALLDLQTDRGLGVESLNIADPRKYFEGGPSEGGGNDSAPKAEVQQDVAKHGVGVLLDGLNPRSLPCPVIKPALCAQVLTEVCQRVQATLAEQQDGFMVNDPKEVLLPALQQALREQAMLANELLRHFWPLFPISSSARAQKLERIKQSLSKQYDHLQAMQDAAHGSDRIYISQVLRPCMQALDAAFSRYDDEQRLRAAKRQKTAASRV
mmetsp:Transcript_31576/g.89667  ORF Transcript_31576/g.89667 Transcript_31576/m.89667 type:complete len:606 (+) Transcript_31576:109-1926(+)